MTHSSFLHKTILITGASAGFGAETARQFAKEGARLILLARRKDRLVALQQELREAFKTESEIMAVDITDFNAIGEELKRVATAFGMPEILINNAGLVRGMDKLWEITPNQWNEMIDANIKGILNMTRQILPSMLKANQGHIINIGSISGHGTYPGGGVYCATKFAVRAITDTLRMELVATPLRVSLLSPGMAKTEFSAVRFYGDQTKANEVYQGIEPLTAADIAEAILFIASRPPHVNIADMIIFPQGQASTTFIHRQS
jgi:3-hydroxy acid dehydrogenase / malonic semialdehyde reductase